MTREEAINELKMLKENYWDVDGYEHEIKQYDDTMLALDMAIKALEQEPKWIPISERLPNNHEYIKNNGLFNVSDGNKSYFEWFDIHNTKKFVKPTIAGFCVDNAVTAWMPLPIPYEPQKSEDT